MEKRTKKVLIVTYHWPPSGGISVLRSLKIAKYLDQFGWEPIVFTPKNAQYPIIDNSNLKDIPKDITVIQNRIIEPFELFKKLTGRSKNDTLQNVLYLNEKKNGLIDKFFIWIRGNFFIPDARALWVKPSVKYLTKYLEKNPVDAIFSDGPPHSNTLIACKVSEKTEIPWLADFQDPWTQVDYYKDFMITRWADEKHKRLEQECFEQASKITIVTDSWKKDLENIGAKNVSVIPWGYDEDDYVGVKRDLSPEFLISHIGVLGSDRLPKTLLKVLADISNEISDFRNDLKLKLVGSVDHELIRFAQTLELASSIEIVSHLPRKEALEEVFGSQLLLLLINKASNAKGRMPAKLFEYLKADRPILCLGPTDSDVATIIERTQTGTTIDYENYGEIKTTVLEYYKKFKHGSLNVDARNIEDYSIEFLTGEIAKYLDEITN